MSTEDMKMKKILGVTFGTMFLLAIFTGLGWALEVSPGNVSGNPGEAVVVPINVSDLGGGLDADAFSFTLQFDPTVLEYQDVDKTGTLLETFSLVAGQLVEPGKVKVSGALFGVPVHISTDGLLLNLNFTVKAEAAKDSGLQLSDFKDDIKAATTAPVLFKLLLIPALKLPSNISLCPGKTASIPLTLNNTDSIGIESLDLKIQFDETVLVATGMRLKGGILANQNYGIIPQVEDGEISATIYAKGDLFTGNGIIAYLDFYVVGNEGDTTVLTFAKAKLNESPSEANAGLAEVGENCHDRYEISGNITYYGNDDPVSNVLVELGGDDADSKVTNGSGAYVFPDVLSGDYTLTPSKNDQFGGISGTDASRIAKHTVGLYDFDSCYERIAADADGDGQITGVDASRVARYAAGKISYLNSKDIHWAFIPDDPAVSCDGWPPISYTSAREYAPLDSDRKDAGFVAIRLGDVSGNWADEPVKTKSFERATSAWCEISADHKSGLRIPIVLEGETEIESIDIRVKFNKSVLDVRGMSLTGGILENRGYGLQANTRIPGEVTIVIFSNADIFTGSGDVAFIEFDIEGSPGSLSAVSFAKFDCNESPVIHGGFKTDAGTCQNISVYVGNGADTDIVR